MSEAAKKKLFNAIGFFIVLAIFVSIGLWSFSWSTHTLVWLSFMGFSLASWGNMINRK